MSFTRKIIQTSKGWGGLPYTGIDLTDQKFGRWTVLSRGERPEEAKGNSIWWNCKCKCGGEKAISASVLKNGLSKSCGCFSLESKHNAALPFGHASRNALFSVYRKDAARRGYEWGLSLEQFTEITSSDCSYCGLVPSSIQKCHSHNGAYIHNGIDRVNNDVGYILENSVACCRRCNYAKGDMTKKDFLDWARRVVQHNGN